MLTNPVTAAVALLVVLTTGLPVRREVPQEHSHESIITSVRGSLFLDNPDQIQDPIFALLGDAAAANGAGNINNPSCLQQAVADQAFTNAKAANDVQGMTDALIFRALERNTGKVGLQSNLCNQTAKNPEIQALSQHQDPASQDAATTNKNITLELAKQIASVGGDPLDAIKSGTFPPGDVNDPTAKGNTCDDANDPVGCIFTLNLLVPDATPDEINNAVAKPKAAPKPKNGKSQKKKVSRAAGKAAVLNAINNVTTVIVSVSVGDASAAQISSNDTTVVVSSGNASLANVQPSVVAADGKKRKYRKNRFTPFLH